MTLRDKFYLRFFLFHSRFGRVWAAMLAFVVYCLFIVACIAAMWALVQLSIWWYDSSVAEHTKVYQQEAASYQRTLIACLNGGVIGKAGDEVIACDPAVTFKFGRVR